MLTPSNLQNDLLFMNKALQRAEIAFKNNEVPVGALVVRDGEIIACAENRTIGDCDPSAHAEIIVLRQAAQKIANHRLLRSTLYVTLEPCVMCFGALLQARISRLVFAAYDERGGACGSALDINHNKQLNHCISEIKGGVLAAQSQELLRQFFQQRRDN